MAGYTYSTANSNSSGGSTASGGSESTSTPNSLQTPQSELETQIAALLGNLGQSTYNWAQGQFANTSNLTDANINNYNNSAQYGLGLAKNTINEYQNTFEPLQQEYAAEAGTYASAPRIAQNMGAAESATGQAMNQGRINAEQTLQGYGIDPSSGRYQELEQSQRAGAAAAQAGAGQQSELATEATGRQMLTNAIAMGQQLPGQAVNELNSAYQGIAGAENSALGLANTGATLADAASPYFNAAMSLKYPPVGNYSQSTSANNSQSANRSTSNQQSQSTPNGKNGGSGGYGQNGGGSPGIYSGLQGKPAGNNGPGWVGGPGYGTSPSADSGGYTAPGLQMAPGDTLSGGGSNYTAPGLSEPSQVNYLNGGNYGSDQSYQDMNNSASGGNYGSYGGYAKGGGVIPHGNGGTSGGFVPRNASPSGGAQTDDIPARLNAREFVIPQDVADWKGQEFFQKLIEQSRKARQGAPAAGQNKAPLPNQGQPTFVSRKLPPAGVPHPGAMRGAPPPQQGQIPMGGQ